MNVAEAETFLVPVQCVASAAAFFERFLALLFGELGLSGRG